MSHTYLPNVFFQGAIRFKVWPDAALWAKLKPENKCPKGWRAYRGARRYLGVLFVCNNIDDIPNMTPEWIERIHTTLTLIKVPDGQH